MNVVDSSGWLEYFADSENAGFFAAAIEKTGDLVVPTFALYEVFKVVYRQRGETPALSAVALMRQGLIADLTPEIALAAARIGIEEKLPAADSIMLATARAHKAVFWTQDADFERIQGVRFIRKL